MTPRFYLGTIGFSVWYSDDLGETWNRLLTDSGLYSESRCWSLAYHKDRPGQVLAGTDSGIYRHDRASGKWTHLNSPMNDLCVWSIAHSPSNPDVILAGTRPGALFRSEDGGGSWRDLGVPFAQNCAYVIRPRVTQITFDPDDPSFVIASAEVDGVRRSRDGGETWEKIENGLISDDVHGAAVVRDGARRLFVTTNKGLHISDDDGENWRMQPLASEWQYTRAVAPHPSRDGSIYLTNGDGPPGSSGRVWRSRDRGDHWNEIVLPVRLNSTPYIVAVTPAAPDLIFIVTNLGQIFRSTDRGESWTKLERELGEVRASVLQPN